MANTKAKGTTGTWISNGRVEGVEDNRKLRADLARGTPTSPGEYDRMLSQDPQIRGAVIRPIVATLLDAGAEIVEPEGADAKDKEITAFISASWEDLGPRKTIRDFLSYISRGFSLLEVVLKRTPDKLLAWRMFGPRLQRTVLEWRLGTDEELSGVVFEAPFQGDNFREYTLDAVDLLHFSLDQEGNNFEGVSLLRPAYTFWLVKQHIIKATAIDVERAGGGFMVFKRTVEGAASTKEDKALIAQTALNWRFNEAAYADLPFGVELDFEFPNIPFEDRIKILRYLDQQIAKSALTTFLELGLEKAGTQSLGNTQVDLFIKALGEITGIIEDVMNGPGGRSVNGPIQKLVNQNWGLRERYPLFRFRKISRETAAESLEALTTGVTGNVFGEWRNEDANVVRAAWDLSPLPIDEEDAPGADTNDDDETQDPPPGDDAAADDADDAIDEDGQALRDKPDGGRCFRRVRPGTEHEVFDGVGARMVVHRPLNECETVVAFSELESLFNISETAFETAVRPVLDAAATTLAEQVREIVFSDASNPDKLRALNALSISDVDRAALETAVAGHLSTVARNADDITGREITRQIQRGGVQKLQKPGGAGTQISMPIGSVPTPDMPAIVESSSVLASQGLVDDVAASIRTSAANAVIAGTEPVVAIQNIEQAVSALSPGFFRKHAAQVTSIVTNQQRMETAQRTLLDMGLTDVAFVQFSSVLDGNTCNPCGAADGSEVTFNSPEFHFLQPPYQGCDSSVAQDGNRCRCLYVFVGATEEPQLA